MGFDFFGATNGLAGTTLVLDAPPVENSINPGVKIVVPSTTYRDGYPRVGRGNPKFQEHCTLAEAVRRLSVNVHAIKSGGGTQRVGWVLKQMVADQARVKVTGIFGGYRPTDVMAVCLDRDFVTKFQKHLDAWKKDWSTDVTAETVKSRDAQYKAALAWAQDATKRLEMGQAIETILALSATNSVKFVDKSDNSRPLGLVGILDVMMLINLTATRLAKLGIVE